MTISTDADRQEAFNRTLLALNSLIKAIDQAGGMGGAVVDIYMNRPLREFLAQVVVPNDIRFSHHYCEVGVPSTRSIP